MQCHELKKKFFLTGIFLQKLVHRLSNDEREENREDNALYPEKLYV